MGIFLVPGTGMLPEHRDAPKKIDAETAVVSSTPVPKEARGNTGPTSWCKSSRLFGNDPNLFLGRLTSVTFALRGIRRLG